MSEKKDHNVCSSIQSIERTVAVISRRMIESIAVGAPGAKTKCMATLSGIADLPCASFCEKRVARRMGRTL
jgi:hypothetical protein